MASVATIQGGATAVDVISAAEPHGLVAATGNCGAVGMVGLTTGGGYGPLVSRYGLASDNLLGAEVVLADGRLVHCDERENPDLFWAVRGGGGNFGVVTSMRVRLHPIRHVLAGMMVFAWSQAESVLRGYAEVISHAPDELSIFAGVLPGPDGSSMVLVAPMWSSEAIDGEKWIARLRQLGTPVVDKVGPMNYGDYVGMFGAASPVGRHYAGKNRLLGQLTPEVISTLVAGGQQRSSISPPRRLGCAKSTSWWKLSPHGSLLLRMTARITVSGRRPYPKIWRRTHCLGAIPTFWDLTTTYRRLMLTAPTPADCKN